MTDQPYGALPPVAVREPAYALPVQPVGRTCAGTRGGPAMTPSTWVTAEVTTTRPPAAMGPVDEVSGTLRVVRAAPSAVASAVSVLGVRSSNGSLVWTQRTSRATAMPASTGLLVSQRQTSVASEWRTAVTPRS